MPLHAGVKVAGLNHYFSNAIEMQVFVSVPRRCFESHKLGRVRVGGPRAEEMNERWSSTGVCELTESPEGKYFGKETQRSPPIPPGVLS